jgi:hypothetical protein
VRANGIGEEKEILWVVDVVLGMWAPNAAATCKMIYMWPSMAVSISTAHGVWCGRFFRAAHEPLAQFLLVQASRPMTGRDDGSRLAMAARVRRCYAGPLSGRQR